MNLPSASSYVSMCNSAGRDKNNSPFSDSLQFGSSEHAQLESHSVSAFICAVELILLLRRYCNSRIGETEAPVTIKKPQVGIPTIEFDNFSEDIVRAKSLFIPPSFPTLSISTLNTELHSLTCHNCSYMRIKFLSGLGHKTVFLLIHDRIEWAYNKNCLIFQIK